MGLKSRQKWDRHPRTIRKVMIEAYSQVLGKPTSQVLGEVQSHYDSMGVTFQDRLQDRPSYRMFRQESFDAARDRLACGPKVCPF
jgi:hypothetical protein